jgi:hypothetical protein
MAARYPPVFAILMLCVSSASAQERPNLSGTWTADTAAESGLPAAPTPVFGSQFELRLDGDKLTVVRPVRDTLVTANHVLDGRETRTVVPGPLCQGDAQTIETVAWDGEAIVFTVVGSVPPGAGTPNKMNITRVFRLQAPDMLVVEGTTRLQGKPARVGTVYRRTSEKLKATGSPLPAVATTPATIAQVGWIAGVWAGATGPSSVEERWTPPAGGSMLAISRTLRNETMMAFEFLCIAERDGSLLYSAMPNGRTPATHFMLTSITTDVATFENPSHDYPKLIRYTKKPDGSLETTIAGENGQRVQSVILKKQGP